MCLLALFVSRLPPNTIATSKVVHRTNMKGAGAALDGADQPTCELRFSSPASRFVLTYGSNLEHRLDPIAYWRPLYYLGGDRAGTHGAESGYDGFGVGEGKSLPAPETSYSFR